MELPKIVQKHPKMSVFGFVILSYFFIMDTILHITLKNVNLVEENAIQGAPWSPFHPLTVKLLLTDHVAHYAFTPLSEYFIRVTGFSDTFNFITPNMVTFGRLAFMIPAAKYIVSESLSDRRIGVLLFQVGMFLDVFDGSLYMSRAANKSFQSNHGTSGYLVDVLIDMLGGTLLCLAIFCFLLWKVRPQKQQTLPSWTIDEQVNQQKCVAKTPTPCLNDETSKSTVNTTSVTHIAPTCDTEYDAWLIHVFWSVLCVRILLAMFSAMWNQTITGYEEVFTVELDKQHAILQSESLHKTNTWVIFLLWRIMGGQTITQMILLAIFVDKVWEFLRFVQYLGFVVFGLLSLLTYIHINEIRHVLQL